MRRHIDQIMPTVAGVNAWC